MGQLRWAELEGTGLGAGLDVMAATTAEPFTDARRTLEERSAAGINGSMQFTYRKPSRSTDPAQTLPGVRTLIAGATSYHRDPPPQPDGVGPIARVARYVWADDQDRLLAGLQAVCDALIGAGHRACVVADQNHLVDRPVAERAGLGWFGKNANLLLPGRGSWYLLGTVLTDADLADLPGAPEAEPVADGCGTCERCIPACPTGAIVAPGVVDARRCLSWSLQVTGSFPRDQRVAVGDRLYGCDECQEVCPTNRLERRKASPGGSGGPVPVGDPQRAWVPVLGLLAAPDDDLLDRHGRWYIPEHDPRYLRRNALVVLGNIGDGRDPQVRAALQAALEDPDPLLRAHAVWSARRLGCDDLLVHVQADPDPEVQAELAAPVPVRGRRVKHLLVTNDFPPKIGGIQSYLWELWRRLPADEASVLTTAYDGAAEFDAAAPIHVERIDGSVMLPTRSLVKRIDETAERVGAEIVLLDPALPLGQLGPRLARPYGVVLHGAEITVPGRVPGPRHALARVLKGAEIVIAAGGYPADEGERATGRGLPVVVIPPGVDTDRFVPLTDERRAEVRARFGVAPESTLVVSVSRLVPRKGMDTLIRAAARLAPVHPSLEVVIGGSGRDLGRLERLVAELGAPVRLVGRVDDADLPGLYGAADVFAMDCRTRWFGLEQEGFGIVFLEAAACAVAQVAGDSGGSAEAVLDGETGIVVRDPESVAALADALRALITDPERRTRMGQVARARAEAEFSYDVLAAQLRSALDGSGFR